MSNIRSIQIVLTVLLISTACRDELSAGDADMNISDHGIPMNVHESALIGLHLAEIGALEEVTAEGAELAAQLQRDILFSEMDLSRFAVPDTETLEFLVGAKLREGGSSELEAVVPQDTNVNCDQTCCTNPYYLYRYSRPTLYTRYNSECAWTPIGSTTYCTCAY